MIKVIFKGYTPNELADIRAHCFEMFGKIPLVKTLRDQVIGGRWYAIPYDEKKARWINRKKKENIFLFRDEKDVFSVTMLYAETHHPFKKVEVKY